jgi:non-specific serine/threonine protein kinase
VVLDNCEHVIDACAALADRLLRRCPGLTILATSRTALGIEGEVVWPVAPLAHPAAGSGAGSLPDPEALAAALAGYDAVQLFVERARAVQPDFALTARTGPAVAAITARLDGLPLALELAAANVATLGVEALAARLDDAFAVLTRGRRTALPRHRTLRALLDWSYDLLGPAEQRLLARLSVFRGAFTLEQAEAVCAAPEVPAHAADGERDDASGGALAALGRLVEQSLVDVRDVDGDARYRLLETVRQYGGALLRGTPDELRTRARHAESVAALVDDVGPRLWSVERRRARAAIQAVYDDVRAALAWATEAVPPALAADGASCALRIAGGLTWFYFSAGRWDDARRAYAAALAAAERAGFAADPRAPALVRTALANTYYLGSAVAWLDGDMAASRERGLASAGLWETLAADATLAPAARRRAERGLSLAREMTAQSHAIDGDLGAAAAVMEDALAAAERAGDERNLAAVRARRGFVRVMSGDHAGAEGDFTAALAAYDRVGERWLASLAYQGLAVRALAQCDAQRAVAHAVACVEAVRDEDDPWFLTRGLDTLGAALAAAGDAAAGAEFLGAADALRRRAGVVLHPFDRPMEESAARAARAALGAAAFDAARTAGGALAPDALFARVAALAGGQGAAVGEAPAAPPAAPPVGAPRAVPIAPPRVPAGGAAGDRPALQVLAFGEMAVARGGVALGAGDLSPAKARELLLFLVLSPPRTKEQIAVALWPDASEARVRNAFHVTLHHVRRILGGRDAVVFDGGTYSLRRPDPDGDGAGALDCDVDAMLAAAAAARAADRAAEEGGARGAEALAAVGADAAALAAWRRALDRAHRGPLGGGTDGGEWLAPHEARVRAAWGNGMEALARLHARRGATAEAAATLEALVAADALRETAHRALMACYAAAGEPARALAHYDALAGRLRHELGAPPARDTRALADAIRRGA